MLPYDIRVQLRLVDEQHKMSLKAGDPAKRTTRNWDDEPSTNPIIRLIEQWLYRLIWRRVYEQGIIEGWRTWTTILREEAIRELDENPRYAHMTPAERAVAEAEIMTYTPNCPKMQTPRRFRSRSCSSTDPI